MHEPQSPIFRGQSACLAVSFFCRRLKTGILRTTRLAGYRAAPFAALSADVLAHVLGFIAHERWEYHMEDTPLSCVQRLNQVFSSLAIMLTAELRRCTPRGCSRRDVP